MSKDNSKQRKKKRNAAAEEDELPIPVVPDSAELLRQSDRFTDLMVAIFLGIAGILILTTALWATSIGRRQTAETRIQGVVVELMIGEYDNGDEFFFPVVEFPLPDGTRKTLQMTEGSSTRDYEPGQSVTIRYPPGQADEARIQSLASTALLWIGPILTGLLGACFFAITIFTWTVFRREKQAREEGEHEEPQP